MSVAEELSKWFMKPKNQKGMIVFTIIMIVLALDFAYWAGAIDVIFFDSDGRGDDVDEEIAIPEDYDSDVISDTLVHGRKLYAFQQLGDDPRGEAEGETYNLYSFPVETNNSEVQIVSDGDPGRPRIDTGDRNDIDLYIYAPGKDAGGDFEGTDPDHESATSSIQEAITERLRIPGNWTLRVDCYTGEDVSYTVQIQVFYSNGNDTDEEP
jgi:hypothetical protein